MQLMQVRGFYRVIMGDFEFAALFDGGISIGSSLLRGDPALIQSLLLRSFFDDPQKMSPELPAQPTSDKATCSNDHSRQG